MRMGKVDAAMQVFLDTTKQDLSARSRLETGRGAAFCKGASL